MRDTVSERGNPLQPQKHKNWKANAKSATVTTLCALNKEIAAQSSVNPADTQVELTERFANDTIARLYDFSAFQVNVSSQDDEKEEKFNDFLIKGSKVVFRSGKDLKEMQKNLIFETI